MWYKSRQLWTLLADFVFSVLVLLVTKYMAPEFSELALTLIGYLQPVVMVIIAMFTVDDTIKAISQAWERVQLAKFNSPTNQPPQGRH